MTMGLGGKGEVWGLWPREDTRKVTLQSRDSILPLELGVSRRKRRKRGTSVHICFFPWCKKLTKKEDSFRLMFFFKYV